MSRHRRGKIKPACIIHLDAMHGYRLSFWQHIVYFDPCTIWCSLNVLDALHGSSVVCSITDSICADVQTCCVHLPAAAWGNVDTCFKFSALPAGP